MGGAGKGEPPEDSSERVISEAVKGPTFCFYDMQSGMHYILYKNKELRVRP
jgi:hypothetical protein